jgi:hypothetical protein
MQSLNRPKNTLRGHSSVIQDRWGAWLAEHPRILKRARRTQPSTIFVKPNERSAAEAKRTKLHSFLPQTCTPIAPRKTPPKRAFPARPERFELPTFGSVDSPWIAESPWLLGIRSGWVRLWEVRFAGTWLGTCFARPRRGVLQRDRSVSRSERLSASVPAQVWV